MASSDDFDDPYVFDSDPVLRKPPVQRAAYSDRMAWLMSSMSELAYRRFEGGDDLRDLVRDLLALGARGGSGARDIENKVIGFLTHRDETAEAGRKALEAALATVGFVLVGVYNEADTQAFLAKRVPESPEQGAPMRILVFRGTEKNLDDIRTDARANLTTPDGCTAGEKVHAGFHDAFKAVRARIENDLAKDPEIPLFITGHSLGGALAVVATRLIASDSLGACYSFGGPRAGNLELARTIKTPVYRIVNSADAVPRLPPAFVIPVLIAVLKWAPAPLDWLIRFLERFQGYVHFGDMRYLTHADGGEGDLYPGLVLHSNPSLPLRANWWVRRMLATYGRAGYEDHSIACYRRKLRAYAIRRN